jgi:hypothetical protein
MAGFRTEEFHVHRSRGNSAFEFIGWPRFDRMLIHAIGAENTMHAIARKTQSSPA